jgi:mannose-1-phosphate guanylyltransferase
MKAMVLCAGHGTRLHPITLKYPKPLVPILGKPILHHIFDHLEKFGVKDVAINSSIMPEKFEESISEKNDLGLNIIHSYEGHNVGGFKAGLPLGSAGGLQKVQRKYEFFNDSFIVICGDALVDIDFEKMMKFHKSHGGIATIASLEVAADDVSNYGVIVTENDGSISAFQEKPSQSMALSNQVNAGIYIFEPEIFTHIPINGAYDIGSELFPKLIEERLDIYAYHEQFNWIDFGKLSDYSAGCFSALCGKIKTLKLDVEEFKPGVFIEKNVVICSDLQSLQAPIFIGEGTIVKSGTVIVGPTIIGSDCVVESDAYISNSIISSGKHIYKNAFINEKTFFSNWMIEQHDWIECEEVGIRDQFFKPIDNDVDCIILESGTRDRIIM